MVCDHFSSMMHELRTGLCGASVGALFGSFLAFSAISLVDSRISEALNAGSCPPCSSEFELNAHFGREA